MAGYLAWPSKVGMVAALSWLTKRSPSSSKSGVRKGPSPNGHLLMSVSVALLFTPIRVRVRELGVRVRDFRVRDFRVRELWVTELRVRVR